MTINNRGGSRQWRKLRAQVITEEPLCQIRGPKCSHISTTADHIVPRSKRPDLAMVRSNLRGACGPCNYGRGNRMKGTDYDYVIPASVANRPRALNFFNHVKTPVTSGNVDTRPGFFTEAYPPWPTRRAAMRTGLGQLDGSESLADWGLC